MDENPDLSFVEPSRIGPAIKRFPVGFVMCRTNLRVYWRRLSSDECGQYEDDNKSNVKIARGLQQRQAHRTQSVLNIAFYQFSVAAQVLEDLLQRS